MPRNGPQARYEQREAIQRSFIVALPQLHGSKVDEIALFADPPYPAVRASLRIARA
jgi:hypothetical protein